MAELPFLDLPGEPSRRGEAHGEALREPIRATHAAHLARALASPAAARRGVADEAGYLAHARRHEAAAEAWAPGLWRECLGIARGAGVTPAHVMALNLHLEFADLANLALPDPGAGGCTSFGLQRADGTAVIGQTYDLRRYFEPAAFCFRTPLEGGGVLTALAFAGTVGAAGLNSHGLGVVINKLFGRDVRPGGLPYPFVLRRMLEAATPGRALSLLIPAERAASMHYLLADREGLLYPIEASARGFEVLETGADGIYAHANHFLGPRGKGLEARDFSGVAAHTLVRQARATQLLRRLGRDAPAERVRGLMADGHNFPCGICAVGADGDPMLEGKTVARVLLEPSAGRAAYALGHDASNPWRTFELG